MEAFDSISAGCFVILPKNHPQQASPSRRKPIVEASDLVDQQGTASAWGFRKLLNEQEHEDLVALRYRLFDHVWAHMQQETQAILEEVNRDSLTQISEYVQQAFSQ
ncbi:hypothetical protein IWQ62_005771, partial [Dispira parvispora]